jgi:hypothetical protein
VNDPFFQLVRTIEQRHGMTERPTRSVCITHGGKKKYTRERIISEATSDTPRPKRRRRRRRA